METPPIHLEQMGRELKCPICLSLLSSAVSLNCNHVFCNSCIVKSMKSGSNCPVCTIPFRRREVRPAPHMDNLVSIYKSMEVASGVSIYVSQNAPPANLSDGKQQDIPEICEERIEQQKTLRGKGSRKTRSDLNNCGSVSVKPSFPTKKRVQVPQGPLSETPTRPKQLVADLTDERSKQTSTLKENPVVNEKGDAMLSPFFWLRDEDVENLSPHTSNDQLTDVPSPNVPTFSDIKDSDDENCGRTTPPGELQGKSHNGADLFDSEMFEWTQRACSPELLSSPAQTQAADDNRIDGIPLKELKEISQNKKLVEHSAKSARTRNSRKSSGNMDVLPDLPPAVTEDANHQVVSNESNKRARQARSTTKRKCAKILTDQGVDVTVDLFHEEVCKKNGSSLAKTSKRSKEEHKSVVATKPTMGNVDVLCTEGKCHDHQGDKGTTELPTSLGKTEGCDAMSSQKAGKMCKEINVENQMDQMHRPVRSRKQKMVSMPNKVLEVSETQKQSNKDSTTELSRISHPADYNKNASELKNRSRKIDRKAEACDPQLKSNKKAKVSSDDNSRDDVFDEVGEGNGIVNETGNHPTEKIKGNLVTTDQAPPVQKLPSLSNTVVLKKCEAIPRKFQCAFCRSSEESKASGEIVHYYNGKPIAADHNGDLKVIHAHRVCTEWAPKVYFEDDIAINLEAEITRSCRIKCSCCEIKGAALGCYERSCHRSFHVTCAQLMPECRWDTDNFVMLCPLHASSELPGESSKSQARRKKGNPRKQSTLEDHKVAVKQDISTHQNLNFCGSSKKLVLCCSSLTNAERESVSGFERLSGVSVLKNWDSSVTHVIASTDETGACRRTLKVLMGILEGKWILNMDWINACTKAMKLVSEEPYEIAVDIYGIRDGPQLGRLRIENKEPKLFDGLKFYFMGDFIPSYKGYLQDLIIAAGGTILHRKPIPEREKALSAGSPKRQTFIIYSLEQPDQCHSSKKTTILKSKQSDAKALASSDGAKVVNNSWVLNSIAACKLQSFSDS